MSMPSTTAFLLGVPRSGTTLLSVLLNRHPSLYCPTEPWLLLALAQFGRVPPVAACGPRILRDALAEFLENTDHAALMRGWAERGYSAQLQAAGRQIFIDKTPRYYQVLEHLQRWFPDAPRIILVRHPLDVAASMTSTWQVDLAEVIRRMQDHRLAIDYCVGHARLATFLATLAPLKGSDTAKITALVRYEELVRDPALAMVPVWRALGVDPVPLGSDLMDLDQNPALRGRMGDPKIRSTSSVHQQSCGRWRTALTPADAKTLAEALGQSVFDQLGYGEDYREVTSHKHSPAGAFYASCLAAREREVEDLDDEVIPGDRLRLGQQVAEVTARAEAGDRALSVAQQECLSSTIEATAVRAVAEERLSLIQRLESDLHDRSLAAARVIADLTADQAQRQTDQDAQERQLEDARQEMRGLHAALDERLALIKSLDSDLAERGVVAEQAITELRADQAQRLADQQAQTQEIETLRAALDERLALIQSLESDLAERDAAATRELATVQAETHGLRAALDERLALINALEHDLAKRGAVAEQAITELRTDQTQRLADQQAQAREILGLRAALDERLTLINALEQELTTRGSITDQAITELRADQANRIAQQRSSAEHVAGLQQEISGLHVVLDQRLALILSLERDLAARGVAANEVIASLRADQDAQARLIVGLQREILNLHAALAERLALITSLEGQITERTAAADLAIANLRADQVVRVADQQAKAEVIAGLQAGLLQLRAEIAALEDMLRSTESSLESQRQQAGRLTEALADSEAARAAAEARHTASLAAAVGELAARERSLATEQTTAESLRADLRRWEEMPLGTRLRDLLRRFLRQLFARRPSA